MKVSEKLKSFLFARQQAYLHTFHKENVYAVKVLKDLEKFCRGHETTFHEDPRIHAVLEGRREVLLRIQKHLNLTSEEIWELYGRPDLE